MLRVGTHEYGPGGGADMRQTLRQRGTLRLEFALVRLAAFAVVLAGTWFIAWQLSSVLGTQGT